MAVVAHSLGTVVAYETLALHPEWDVAGLVTMGSPLGGPRILDLLEPGPVDGRGRFPAGTRSWVNIRNADDPACIRSIPEMFDGPVTERLVDNGHRVHDPEPYLNNPTTGAAVARPAVGPDGGRGLASGAEIPIPVLDVPWVLPRPSHGWVTGRKALVDLLVHRVGELAASLRQPPTPRVPLPSLPPRSCSGDRVMGRSTTLSVVSPPDRVHSAARRASATAASSSPMASASPWATRSSSPAGARAGR